MYHIVYQQLMKTILKGALLHCKKASFTVSKTICYFQFMNLYYNTINVFFCDNRILSPLALIEEYHLNDYFSIFLSLLSPYPLLQHIDNKSFMRNVKSDSN